MDTSTKSMEGKMRNRGTVLHAALAWLRLGALGMLAVACGGPGAGTEAAISDLISSDGGLPVLDDTSSTAWWLAPPGCEGLLDGNDVAIAIASLEHGLVAAIDPMSGEIICVDTVEAVGAELDQIGRHDEALELTMRFEASEMAAQASVPQPYEGDPHPEPNDGCLNCGDPHPEPN